MFPAWWLALNRSFAVWSTGGLDTKLFELLSVGAVLVVIRDTEARRSHWSAAAVLFGLAALTRPDGLLIGVTVFAARGIYERHRHTLDVRAAAEGIAAFALLVGGHFMFRRVYYAEWLPNTYYAKLAGQSWWAMGGVYFRAFALEYGVLIWGPLLLAGAVGSTRAGRPVAVWIIAAAIVPHALYVAYCGGDHFEYRPLDVYFPLFAVLLCDGVVIVAERGGRPVLAVVWATLSCAAVVVIPLLTHLGFPSDYRPGFPGDEEFADVNPDLVDLHRGALSAVPGMRFYIARYNADMRTLTKRFIGLRQEEHRLFLPTVEPEGKLLARMVASGLLPRDTFIAIPCVGAIPYFSDLRTLDVLGLTDKHVARQALDPTEERRMAHNKVASYDYLDSRQVDVIAPEVHLLSNDAKELGEWRDYARQMGTLVPVYFSQPIFDDFVFFGIIRKPPAAVRARFPVLGLTPGWTS